MSDLDEPFPGYTASLRERLAPYTMTPPEADHGWTVVLIDSSEPADGDFVHVETFDTLAELAAAEALGGRVVQAARSVVEARSR